MLRVGQCEACECWCAASDLVAARVVRPTIAARQRRDELGGGIPGVDDAPVRAYFCSDCEDAIRSGGSGEAAVILRPGDPGFATATRDPTSLAEP
jgi:hypothetical protein